MQQFSSYVSHTLLSSFCICSGQAVVTGVVPSSPQFLHSIFIAHRVQQSHCSSMFHRVLLTHALALSASQFVHKKKPRRIYTSIHSAGLELTKLIYTRLEELPDTPPGRRAAICTCDPKNNQNLSALQSACDTSTARFTGCVDYILVKDCCCCYCIIKSVVIGNRLKDCCFLTLTLVKNLIMESVVTQRL